MIRLPDCKSGVTKRSWKRRAGALPALPTSLRPLHTGGRRLPRRSTKCAGGHYQPLVRASARQAIFGLVAQLAERPVVCGRIEGAIPFGSANLPTVMVPGNQMNRLHKNQTPGGSKPPGSTARGVAATCSAWNRGTAGASPAALTNFQLLPWPNT